MAPATTMAPYRDWFEPFENRFSLSEAIAADTRRIEQVRHAAAPEEHAPADLTDTVLTDAQLQKPEIAETIAAERIRPWLVMRNLGSTAINFIATTKTRVKEAANKVAEKHAVQAAAAAGVLAVSSVMAYSGTKQMQAGTSLPGPMQYQFDSAGPDVLASQITTRGSHIADGYTPDLHEAARSMLEAVNFFPGSLKVIGAAALLGTGITAYFIRRNYFVRKETRRNQKYLAEHAAWTGNA